MYAYDGGAIRDSFDAQGAHKTLGSLVGTAQVHVGRNSPVSPAQFRGMVNDELARIETVVRDAKIVGSTPEELGKHVTAEQAKWTPVVNYANIQMD